MPPIPRRSALRPDLFADAAHKRKIQSLGDPLQLIARHIDFAHLAQTIDTLLPRSDGHKGPSTVSHRGHGAHPGVNEQTEYQLLDRMSYQRLA